MSQQSGDEAEIATVTVTIYGEEYRVRADRHPERVRRLAEQVDRTMRAISDDAPRLSVSRVAVLAALRLADELMEAERQAQQLTTMLQREWQDSDGEAESRGREDGQNRDAGRTADAAGRDSP